MFAETLKIMAAVSWAIAGCVIFDLQFPSGIHSPDMAVGAIGFAMPFCAMFFITAAFIDERLGA